MTRPLIPALALSILLMGSALPTVAAPVVERTSLVTALSWSLFDDPLLNTLIERARRNNPDVRIAASRLVQAQATARVARSGLWPQLNAQAQTARSDSQSAAGTTDSHSLALDFTYEVDLIGRQSSQVRIADLSATEAQARLGDAHRLIASAVAQTYFALRTLDEERAIVAATVSTYRDSLQLTRRLYEEGRLSHMEVTRLEADLAQTEAEAVALDRQRAQLVSVLALLIGETPEGMDEVMRDWPHQPLPTQTPPVPVHFSTDDLAYRPDVVAAQAALDAAAERVGLARTAWFPRLFVTASGQYSAPDLSGWTVAALVSQTVFDGGRKKALRTYAEAGLNEALTRYQQVLLTAVHEVSVALSSLSFLDQQYQLLTTALKASDATAAQAQARYENGQISQLEWLDARRQNLRIQRQHVQIKGARYRAIVSLIRATGGI